MTLILVSIFIAIIIIAMANSIQSNHNENITNSESSKEKLFDSAIVRFFHDIEFNRPSKMRECIKKYLLSNPKYHECVGSDNVIFTNKVIKEVIDNYKLDEYFNLKTDGIDSKVKVEYMRYLMFKIIRLILLPIAEKNQNDLFVNEWNEHRKNKPFVLRDKFACFPEVSRKIINELQLAHSIVSKEKEKTEMDIASHLYWNSNYWISIRGDEGGILCFKCFSKQYLEQYTRLWDKFNELKKQIDERENKLKIESRLKKLKRAYKIRQKRRCKKYLRSRLSR